MTDHQFQPRISVSAIIEKRINNQRYIFIQTRWKQQGDPLYRGVLEIPAGSLEPHETVHEALIREVREETGLEVVKFLGDSNYPSEARQDSASAVFQPFLCQQALSTTKGIPWVGFVFRCEVEGEVKMQSTEAKDPQWITVAELEEILHTMPQKIFPLQLGALRWYVNLFKEVRWYVLL